MRTKTVTIALSVILLLCNACQRDESLLMLPPSGLVNGGFEYGNLSGWEYDGHASVLTALDTLTSWDGKHFVLLSTGLDSVYEFGEISHAFIVKKEHVYLSFRYALILEDFPACKTNQPQDYFKVSLTAANKQEKMLLLLNAGMVAFKFGAQDMGTGELLPVAETIFTQGYTTGWQEVSIHISEYQGEEVMLTFEAIKPQGSKYGIGVMVDGVEVE